MASLSVGVIGAGANTRLHHIPKLQAIEGVSVTVVCNRSAESSARPHPLADTRMRRAAFGVTGAGVQIVFNDDGLDADHAEFSAKFSAAGSCNDPTPVNFTTEHRSKR